MDHTVLPATHEFIYEWNEPAFAIPAEAGTNNRYEHDDLNTL